MSRLVKDDYNALVSFIDQYTIKASYSDEGLIQTIKGIHKHYFAALTLLAELKHQNVQPQTYVASAAVERQRELFWLHLTESFSELGSAFFLILNGCYKASDQVLRSSIENYVKALGGLGEVGLNQTKNLYDVFDKAQKTAFFSTAVGNEVYRALSQLYGSLCSTVHTGTIKDMQTISALGDFPAIDSVKALAAKKKYMFVVRNFVSALAVQFEEGYHKMHYNNRDIVQPCLTSSALNALNKS